MCFGARAEQRPLRAAPPTTPAAHLEEAVHDGASRERPGNRVLRDQLLQGVERNSDLREGEDEPRADRSQKVVDAYCEI